MKQLKIIIIILLLGINKSIPTIDNSIVKEKKEQTDIFGTLIINKIHLKEVLYPIESEKNTIEKHVTILEKSTPPTEEKGILLLAAHSGTGKIAYFEELDELKEKDEIIIHYQKKDYKYMVKDIWEEEKTGFIHINKEEKKQLVLTTCSPKKKNIQLIVNCVEKESN